MRLHADGLATKKRLAAKNRAKGELLIQLTEELSEKRQEYNDLIDDFNEKIDEIWQLRGKVKDLQNKSICTLPDCVKVRAKRDEFCSMLIRKFDEIQPMQAKAVGGGKPKP